MSVTLASHSLVTFEIKSASLSLLTLHLKSVNLDALAAELEARYGGMRDFFEDDLLVVDLAQVSESAATLDFERLKTLLLNYRLRLVAVAGGSPELMAAALKAGLPPASGWRGEQSLQQPSQKPEDRVIEPVFTSGAMVVDRPLRSGQQVYARGRDLVLLAACNPGAEAIADGHVHVYAPLRGRVIAGARGWSEARVFALDMRPELVSVAGVYRTSEQGLAPEVWGQAAMVRLMMTGAGDQLVFKALT